MKLRKLAFNLHIITGLIVGTILVIIGLTGSLLVFDKELDYLLHPQLFQVVPQTQRVALETVLQNARSAYPQAQPSYLDTPLEPDASYKLMMKTRGDRWLDVYINPYSGAILGSHLRSNTLTGFLLNLHRYLLAGESGGIIVGICGLLLLLLSLTGAILWPGWRRLAQGFRIKWHGHSRRVNFDIHKVVGVLSVAFLLLISSTGAAMSFWEPFEQGVYWLTHSSKPLEPSSSLQFNRFSMSLEEILPKASAALPDGKTIGISLAKTSKSPVIVWKKLAGENKLNSGSRVYLDRYTGEVLRVENSLKAPPATQIINSIYPLHIGIYGGLGARLVHLCVGLALPVLFITGFAMWWHRLKIKVSQYQAKVHPDGDYFWGSEWPWY